MQFYQPQIFLGKESTETDYVLHVVTLFPQSDYRPIGWETLPTAANSDGVWQVVLKVERDSNELNFELLTPTVHSLELTGITLSSTAPWIEVEVVEVTTTGNLSTGKGVVHQDHAEEDMKPGPPNL